jgi:hypothetical protein
MILPENTMKHSKIDLPDAITPDGGKRPVPVVVLWLVSLALFQPIATAVICGFVIAMFVPTAAGFGAGLIIGLILTFWIGGKFDGAVRSSQAEQLRSEKRS